VKEGMLCVGMGVGGSWSIWLIGRFDLFGE